MDLEQIVKDLRALTDDGAAAFQRLQSGAKDFGKKQFEALKTQARGKLVGGLMALALKIANNDAEGGSQHERTG